MYRLWAGIFGVELLAGAGSGAVGLLSEDVFCVGAADGCSVGGGVEGPYLTGDSFARKSLRLGSRSRRGSWDLLLSLLSEEPQNQPIVIVEGGVIGDVEAGKRC